VWTGSREQINSVLYRKAVYMNIDQSVMHREAAYMNIDD
jgi:hypothetical protein